MELPRETRDLARDFLQVGEGDHTYFAVFQRHHAHVMMLAFDAVHADDFAGHLKSGNVLTAILRDHIALEETAAHGV